MNWPPYSEYVSSGVRWLDEIPSGWGIVPLKHVATVFPSNVDKHTHDGETPVRLCNYTDVYYNDVINSDLNFMEATATKGEIEKFTLQRGDTIITKDSESADDIGLSAYVEQSLAGVLCGYHLSVIRPSGRLNGRFVKRLFDSHYLKSVMEVSANGLTRVGLGQYAIDNLDIPLPSPSEQAQIVQFLEMETAKIDALIAKQEQLIATLREDRTATITHAVTKGLDPDVETKDSGIDGLGPIPVSWSVTPLLRCVEGRVDYRGATPKKVDDGVLLITARNVRPGWIDYEISDEYVSAEDYGEIMRRGLPEIDDLLFTMEAPLGNAALVDRTDIALAQRIIKFRPDAQVVLPRYLLYSVIGEWFQSQLVARATGSTALGLKASKLPELRVALPHMNEQSRIVEFLDERWAKIDELVAKAAEVVETLREYRSALITAAVTGKIDVRRVA